MILLIAKIEIKERNTLLNLILLTNSYFDDQ